MHVVAIHTLFFKNHKPLLFITSVPVTDLEPVTFTTETSGTTLGNDAVPFPGGGVAPCAVLSASIPITCSSFTK